MLKLLIRYCLLCLLILLNYAIKAQTHTITSLPLSVSTICPGSQISISFTQTGTFDVTNYYSVQLSDGGGYTTISTGSAQYNSQNNTYTITTLAPSNQAAGSTYSIRITASNPAVIGTPSSTKLTIKTKPAPPIVVSPQARCQQVCRSSATCAYTFSGAPSTGASLKWYDSNGNPLTDYSGINSPSFISLHVNNFQVGQNQLYVSQILDGCESDKIPLTVTINPNRDGGPSNTSDISKYAVCQGNGTVSLDKFLPPAPTGFTVYYYKDGEISGASSVPPNISIENATTYLYRTYYLSDKGCRNLNQNDGYVFARINPKPNSPIADAIQLDCQRRSANDAFTNIYFQKITGSTPRIYDSNQNLIQEGGTLGSEPNGVYYAFSKPVANTDNGFIYPVSEKLYYLSQIVDGCESNKTPTLSRILYRPSSGPKPANEFNNGFGRLTYCQGAQSFPLNVNGHSTPPENYTVSYSYNNIATTQSPIPDTNVPGSISYMMRLVPVDGSKGCPNVNGSVTYLNVTINSRPSKPTVPNSTITFFQFQSTSPLTAEGQNLRWYSQDGFQYPNAPTASTNQTDIVKFYVSQTVNDCESERTEITVNVISTSTESVRSLKNGQWTDPTVWSTSKVPTVSDKILLLHTVTVSTNVLAEAKSLTYGVNGRLILESINLRLGFSTP